MSDEVKDAIDELRCAICTENIGRSVDVVEARIAEQEAEMNAWQSLDGINWYERATKAESRLAVAEANYQDCIKRLGEWQSETGCTHPAAAHQKIADRDDLLSGVAASIDLSGLDVSPCMDCGTPIVCIPDGMPMCEKCAGKLELTPEQRDAAIDEAGEST